MYDKLLSNFIRLRSFQNNLEKIVINIEKDLSEQKLIIQHQSKFVSDKKIFDHALLRMEELRNSLETYTNNIQNIKDYYNKICRLNEVSLIQADYKRFENDNTSLEEKLELRNHFSDDITNYIYSLQNKSSDWRYAGLDMNPLDPTFTSNAVASDPLYIIASDDLLTIIKKEFNDFYATRRLRAYHKVEELPDNSIGVAYCFGKYEYWPIDPIKDEIGILFKKIIPGGKFYFTYNNCDFFRSLELCNGVRAYQTEELISNLLYSVGFNKVENVVFNDGVWNIMIVQKPGHLSSIKLNTPSVDMVKVIDSQSN